MTTLLMTDIVDSTTMAEKLGDAAWRQLLAAHDRIIRAQVDRFRGREVSTTGDGFLAMFPSAIGALRCAAAIRDTVHERGIEVRIGVHTGEVEVKPNDIGGIAVHTAARIMALGGASEVIVSSVTRGLIQGSEIYFEERASHRLKGLVEPVQVSLLAT